MALKPLNMIKELNWSNDQEVSSIFKAVICQSEEKIRWLDEPRHEKTGLLGLQPGPTQTRLHRGLKSLI